MHEIEVGRIFLAHFEKLYTEKNPLELLFIDHFVGDQLPTADISI